MKRKKLPPPFVLYVSAALLMYACGRAAGSPAQSIAVAKFQEVVQQQNFFSILNSIEERLKSLDNIYTMQLSQTLETKLDQYSRRLEALDTKIIRLEALVMLNLDKISENISTKNFKDDMSRTNLLRKMDSVYEGMNHRLSYMDRKYETNIAKIQAKVDATLTKLEKIEENITVRDSDIEAEISDTIFAIDDLKTTCATMEEKLYNITSATLNVTRSTYKYMKDMNVDSRKSMNLLHDNIIETLKYMNNKTFRHFKILEDNNVILKTMKTELKEDFNDYASKVADMSSYIWKNSDTTDDDLKRIETFVNNTKIEIQNGVRTLMVQIGKIPNKEISNPLGISISLDEINKNLKTNFQRILTNQDIFLESCHRLQMDEAQIESEISVTLENLINMIEKKIASEMRDIKNLEKILKTHDTRIMRNAYQINNNVISLFEKSTKSNEALSKEVKKISNGLDDLFLFVHGTAATGSPPLISINTKALQDKLNKLENMILTISKNQTQQNLDRLPPSNFDNNLKTEIIEQLQKFSKNLSSIELYINNTLKEETFEKIMNKISQKYFNNCNEQNITKKDENYQIKIDNNTKLAIEEIFGPNPGLTKVNTDSKSQYKQGVRPGSLEGKNNETKTRSAQKNKRKRKKKRPILDLIDVRGNFGPEENLEVDSSEESFESTTMESSLDLITEDILTTEITATTNDEDINIFLEMKPNDTINKI